MRRKLWTFKTIRLLLYPPARAGESVARDGAFCHITCVTKTALYNAL
jgi:hypothetical protein